MHRSVGTIYPSNNRIARYCLVWPMHASVRSNLPSAIYPSHVLTQKCKVSTMMSRHFWQQPDAIIFAIYIDKKTINKKHAKWLSKFSSFEIIVFIDKIIDWNTTIAPTRTRFEIKMFILLFFGVFIETWLGGIKLTWNSDRCIRIGCIGLDPPLLVWHQSFKKQDSCF